MDPSRREFLRRIAAGAAFAAPVIRTLAVPQGLSGQGGTMEDPMSEKGADTTMMGALILESPTNSGIRQSAPGGTAPWETRPPGSGGGGGDGGGED